MLTCPMHGTHGTLLHFMTAIVVDANCSFSLNTNLIGTEIIGLMFSLRALGKFDLVNHSLSVVGFIHVPA